MWALGFWLGLLDLGLCKAFELLFDCWGRCFGTFAFELWCWNYGFGVLLWTLKVATYDCCLFVFWLELWFGARCWSFGFEFFILGIRIGSAVRKIFILKPGKGT
jgi:hypothetical protein